MTLIEDERGSIEPAIADVVSAVRHKVAGARCRVASKRLAEL